MPVLYNSKMRAEKRVTAPGYAPFRRRDRDRRSMGLMIIELKLGVTQYLVVFYDKVSL